DWTLEWYHDNGQVDQLKSRDGSGVLTAEPEITEHQLGKDDEFLLLACDGFWGVFDNQRAVELARLRLQVHNDPQKCAEELVAEAVKRHSTDNISVVLVCFQEQSPAKRQIARTGSGRRGPLKSVSSSALMRLVEFLD
ncbi:uncharacterized protein LOC142354991, partial [Convolutriloba macropyga]|uniref:uncharacterized protein LOC142354991 n=1 Tax=Convolutriloba macropyga TaxID=536237 RepID=UPI003F51C8B8